MIRYIYLVVLSIIFPICASAMIALTDNEMSHVTGQTGISIVIPDIDFGVTLTRLSLTDKDGLSGYPNPAYLVIDNIDHATFGNFNLATKIAMGDTVAHKIGMDPSSIYGTGIKALDIDVGTDSYGSFINIDLPKMQLYTGDFDDVHIRVANNQEGTNGTDLGYFSLPGLYFEGMGGNIRIRPEGNTGNGGIDFKITNTPFYLYNTKLIIRDADPVTTAGQDSLELNQFYLHDGNKNPFILRNGHFSLNVGQEYGKTWLKLVAHEWEGDLYANLGEMKWCGTQFGRWEIGRIIQHDNAHTYISGHSMGLDMEIGARLDIENVYYIYGTGPEDYNNAHMVHAAGSFSGTDNNPATWSFSGNLLIGDIANNRPATLDFGSDGTSNMVALNLPLKGVIGIEKVQLGGTDFGPVIVRGIDIKTFKLFIPHR
ncbi:MAG: hypothetical protein HQK75_10350 [Candidatus Magnetomorum sp.]|nr:hypothetical protein [Candidatus Magnetomorum sp.]